MKILLYDIETSPNLGYIWGKYEQDVIEYEREGHMLSFAYKWLGEKTVKAYSLPDFPLYKKEPENDKALVKKLWELFNEADVVIAHNGDQFDMRKANAFFIANGLTPPSPYKTVDTKKVAKRYFMFNSNKLDDLGNYLGLGRKAQTGGFSLWKGCMEGNMEAWKKMVKYNKQDIVLLEEIYLKLLPWISNHPNVNIFDEKTAACPNCGGQHIQKRGKGANALTTYQRYQCMDCGKWSKSKAERTEISIR